MISLARVALALALLVGCSSYPRANLTLAGIVAHPEHFDVYFDSDVNFLALHEQNRYQTPTSTGLICSLGKNPDFGTDGDSFNPAQGSIEFVNERIVGARKVYRFKSHLIFYGTKEGPPLTQWLATPAEIKSLLSSRPRVACKVRILVYLGPRYFSNTLYLPADQMLDLATKMQ